MSINKLVFRKQSMQFFNPVNEQRMCRLKAHYQAYPVVLFRMMRAQFNVCGDEFSDYTCVQFDFHSWRGRTMRSTFGHVYLLIFGQYLHVLRFLYQLSFLWTVFGPIAV